MIHLHVTTRHESLYVFVCAASAVMQKLHSRGMPKIKIFLPYTEEEGTTLFAVGVKIGVRAKLCRGDLLYKRLSVFCR